MNLLLLFSLVLLNPPTIWAFSFSKETQLTSCHEIGNTQGTEESRRDILRKVTGAAISPLFLPSIANAMKSTNTYISKPGNQINIGKARSKPILIPSIGYSLYKTDPSQVQRGIALALAAGVRHFDVATLYQSNSVAGDLFDSYINTGIIPNATFIEHEYNSNEDPKQARRTELFLSHKVSNAEQSNRIKDVKNRVKEEMQKLQVDYLDLCSVHSPLTNKEKRLSTYEALLELKEEKIIRAVGVCNYGVAPLGRKLFQYYVEYGCIYVYTNVFFFAL